MRLFQPKTLKQRQMETGRTLALNGKAWRDLREVVLHRDPLCVACGAPATDVDHIDNDPTNNSMDNLQPLCHECHSRKTQADMGKAVSYGCDSNGWPLDPASHWQKSPAFHDAEPPCSLNFNANSLP